VLQESAESIEIAVYVTDRRNRRRRTGGKSGARPGQTKPGKEYEKQCQSGTGAGPCSHANHPEVPLEHLAVSNRDGHTTPRTPCVERILGRCGAQVNLEMGAQRRMGAAKQNPTDSGPGAPVPG